MSVSLVVSLLEPICLQIAITRDVCIEGWDTHCEKFSVQEIWLCSERHLYINIPEQRIIRHPLISLTAILCGKVAQVQKDNTIVIIIIIIF